MIVYGSIKLTPTKAAKELVVAALSELRTMSHRKLIDMLDDEGESLTKTQRNELADAFDKQFHRIEDRLFPNV